jgi:hypothetical protein
MIGGESRKRRVAKNTKVEEKDVDYSILDKGIVEETNTG